MKHNAALELFTEFLSQMDRGETPDFEALVAEHPDHAVKLRELFLAECERLEASSQVRQLGEPLRQASAADAQFATEVVQRLGRRTGAFARYSLGDEIGKGGMGSVRRVWDSDLCRDLAMKVTRDDASSLGSSARLTRFLQEAQVTSRLDHPGIVPVHELGVDPAGRVYFTMKLVKGKTFAEVLALVHEGAEGWTQTRALGVIQRVCEAMAYAHEKGVLHRDLKPANVMVGEFGEVYVMDWGLARLFGRTPAREGDAPIQDLPEPRRVERESPVFTRDGQVMGTPAYMPPEQAAGRIEDLGPHSDVYAVGAILYHLLAGHPPHELRTTASESTTQTEARIRPPDPLPRTVPSELAAICEKAMSRDGRERYRDMTGMSADLAAFLGGKVVHAYETGPLAEARKWVRRNRGFAASLAAAVTALVVGLIVSLELKVRADENSEQAERIASFLEQTLSGAKPSVALGRDTQMLGEMMDAAWKRIESGELSSAPEAELRMTWMIGDALRELDQLDRAKVVLRKAIERGRALGNAGAKHLAWSLSDLALVFEQQADITGALDAGREALAVSRRLFPGDHLDVATRLGNLALVVHKSGALAEAEELFQEALAMCQRLPVVDQEAVAEFKTGLANILVERGELEEGIEVAREAQRLLESLFPGPHPSVASAMCNVAAMLNKSGAIAEAETLARRSLEMRRAVFRGDSSDVAHGLDILGTILRNQRKLDDAKPILREALEMRRRLHPGDHRLVAESLNALGVLLRDERDYAAAEELFRETLAMRRRLSPGDNIELATALNNLAMTLRQRGGAAEQEAEPLLLEALQILERVLPEDDPVIASVNVNVGQLLESRGDLAGAEDRLRTARRIAMTSLGATHPSAARAGISLASVLLARENFAEAAQLLLEVESAIRESNRVPPSERKRCLQLLVKTYGAWDEVAPGLGYGEKSRSWAQELAKANDR